MSPSALADYLSPAGYQQPPMWALAKEWTAVPELGRAAARVVVDGRPRLCRRDRPEPQGHDTPVLLVPGFLAGDYSLRVLGATLRRNGYRTYGAHITSNTSCLQSSAGVIEQRLEEIADKRGERVWIVGHSLGGMLARGLAVRRPDLIAGVVTMGSPMMAPGLSHPILISAAEVLMRLSALGVPGLMSESCLAGDCAEKAWLESREPMPAGVPLTCLWSYGDGFVHWKSCVDPLGESVQVRASHIGMAFDPQVADHVLEALRAGPGMVVAATA